MNEIDKVTYFIEGLKQAIQIEVAYQAPDTLDKAWAFAICFNAAMFRLSRHNTSKPQQCYILKTSKENSGPMLMELDFVGSTHNNKKHEKSSQKGNCFKCGQAGHYARNCRVKNKSKLTNIEDKSTQPSHDITNNSLELI